MPWLVFPSPFFKAKGSGSILLLYNEANTLAHQTTNHLTTELKASNIPSLMAGINPIVLQFTTDSIASLFILIYSGYFIISERFSILSRVYSQPFIIAFKLMYIHK